jgi:hypothetical protein
MDLNLLTPIYNVNTNDLFNVSHFFFLLLVKGPTFLQLLILLVIWYFLYEWILKISNNNSLDKNHLTLKKIRTQLKRRCSVAMWASLSFVPGFEIVRWPGKEANKGFLFSETHQIYRRINNWIRQKRKRKRCNKKSMAVCFAVMKNTMRQNISFHVWFLTEDWCSKM